MSYSSRLETPSLIQQEAVAQHDADVTLRHAIAQDLHALMDLLRLKAEFDGCPDALEATPDALERTLFSSQPLAFALLAEVGGVPVGMATYYRTYSTFLARPGLWLDDLYIREPFRGQRIGNLLIQELCCIADQMGGGRIEWTVDITNDRAIGFYQHLGARLQRNVHLCRLDRQTITHHARPIQGDRPRPSGRLSSTNHDVCSAGV